MLASSAPLHAGTLLFLAAASAALVAYVSRQRRVPGRGPFALFMLAVAVWTGAYAVGLLTPTPEWRIPLESVAWFGRASIGVWFLLFALAYTGHDRFLTTRTVGALLAVPATVVCLVWTNEWHGLFWATDPRAILVDGMALVVARPGPAYWASAVYGYLLVAVGAALVLRLVVESEYLYADQSALLVVGIAAPFAGSLATVLPPHPVPGFDYTPYAFAVTGLTFGYALVRGRLFDLVPATRALGRAAAVDEIDAGILVVDADRRILYCNEAAAAVVGASLADVLGRDLRSVVDERELDPDVEDALGEFERDGHVYEVRSSPVTDRRDHTIGHALVVHDVTARRRRERRLATRRDELQCLEELNATIRAVNGALVSATGRGEIERTVSERLAENDRYRTVCVADVPTWTGRADRWIVAGDPDPVPPSLDPERLDRESGGSTPHDAPPPVAPDGGAWCVVPLVAGRTVYGALGLLVDPDGVGDRELEVLGELGEIVGNAIDAAETRQLVSAGTVVELELERADGPLVAAAGNDRRVTLAGVVPEGDGNGVVYLRVDGGDVSLAREALASGTDDPVRTVRDDGDGGLLEWQTTGETLVGTLLVRGNLRVAEAGAGEGGVRYVVDAASGEAARSLADRIRDRHPDAGIVAKRERSDAVDGVDALPDGHLDDLTDRQRESLEAAYRAGYFASPRDSTAEEVAASLDISSPTLHAHLRKAQESLLSDVFDDDAG